MPKSFSVLTRCFTAHIFSKALRRNTGRQKAICKTDGKRHPFPCGMLPPHEKLPLLPFHTPTPQKKDGLTRESSPCRLIPFCIPALNRKEKIW